MNLKGYLNPRVARSLTIGTSERELASCALRNLWHLIFDPCPGLLQMAMPDGKKIMEPFLDWAEGSNLSMTWSLHIHLLNWIEREQIPGLKVLDEIKRELVVASAVRWAAGNMLDAANLRNMGILIRCNGLRGDIIGARKAATADGHPQLKLLQGDPPSATGVDEYALVRLSNGWEHGGWKPIPV
jgi:hypothetical protein